MSIKSSERPLLAGLVALWLALWLGLAAGFDGSSLEWRLVERRFVRAEDQAMQTSLFRQERDHPGRNPAIYVVGDPEFLASLSSLLPPSERILHIALRRFRPQDLAQLARAEPLAGTIIVAQAPIYFWSDYRVEGWPLQDVGLRQAHARRWGTAVLSLDPAQSILATLRRWANPVPADQAAGATYRPSLLDNATFRQTSSEMARMIEGVAGNRPASLVWVADGRPAPISTDASILQAYGALFAAAHEAEGVAYVPAGDRESLARLGMSR